MNANLSRVKFMDVNNRGCPGLSIVTDDGHEIGIYAQGGLGFVLYDYTENRRVGLCPFS